MATPVTISSLEQGESSAPIWALNGSATSKARAAADVHVGIPKINGTKIDPLALPQTWLPICITDQIPRQQLLQSSEFRNAVNSGLIKLITAEYAESILTQDGAEEEKERLNEREAQIREATAARTIQDSGAEVVSLQEMSDINAGAEVAGGEKDDPNALNSGFTMFVEALKQQDDMAALNKIRGRGQYSVPEIKHMLATLHGKEKVKNFLSAHLRAIGAV